MIAFLNLPMQITFWALTAFVVIIAVWRRRTTSILWAILGATIAFVPSCTGVMYVVDQYRYGKFDYPTAQAAPNDGYIEIPPDAKIISIYRSAPGHQARFEITTDQLRQWINQMRSLRPDLNNYERSDDWTTNLDRKFSSNLIDPSQVLFDRSFQKTGWTFDPLLNSYYVARSNRGGGYTIWHTPGTNVAYLDAGYW